MTTYEYNSCVEEFADKVYRFILKNIKDTDKARDIVQEAFAKMWEKVADIAFEKAKPYLFSTAYHTMIDQLRKDKRINALEEDHEQMITTENEYNDLKEVLEQGLTRLPHVQKSVLLLRDYEGYSYQEIGNIMNLNESQVKVYIYRARIFLKDYIVRMENVL
ncbi:MAG: RNA polymerase sigma factor [Bacteroidetes bacterium]|nr:RNA polymerase sigma factor [Bacteroidota bacterium]